MDLLGDSSVEDDEPVKFKINQNYAKNYDNWRKKEERQKLLDKYGEVDSSDSSSEEEEIRSTPQMDKDWLRTYAVVRFQQPRLYKAGEKFFHEEAKPVVKHKEKATTLKDHERKFILEKGGIESDEENKPQEPKGKSYFEEQEEIKKSFKEALKDSSDEDEDDTEMTGESKGLLVKKHKTAEEQKREENEYLEWLKGEREELQDKDAAAELAPLKAYWSDPNIGENERVLRDYILNNGYMDQEESEEETEDEKDAPNFEEEEEFLEKAEGYEERYNFRHEEPDGDQIKSYPRVIETSVRTKDTRRGEARKRKMEKKKVEQDHRNEEIRLLQKLQREEKIERLEALRKIANNPDLEYDLEADFDPEEHKKIMQKYFNDNYYEEMGDGEKPTFEYDAAVDEEPDDWWQARLLEEKYETEDLGAPGDRSSLVDQHDEFLDEEPHADDPDFIMDADYDPQKEQKPTKKDKKGKKSKKALAKKLPIFDPTTKTFDEYIDEYLKDKISLLPFTYRQVVANDFGLSTEEILKANEKELNAWVSVKKMSSYRSKQDELADKRKFAAKSHNVDQKSKILPSLFSKAGESARKKKKKKELTPADATAQKNQEVENDTTRVPSLAEVTSSRLDGRETHPDRVQKRKLSDKNDKTLNSATDSLSQENGVSAQCTKRKHKKVNQDITEGEKRDLDVKSQTLDTKNCTTESECSIQNHQKPLQDLSLAPVKHKKKKKKVQQDTLDHEKMTPELKSPTPKITKSPVKIEHFTKSPARIDGQIEKDQSSQKHSAPAQILASSIVKNKKKKKKKLKELSQLTEQGQSSAPTKSALSVAKKHKKKKFSISNFKPGPAAQGLEVDKRSLHKQLSKLMSASRLSQYGLGPRVGGGGAAQGKKKKRRRRRKLPATQS